MCSLRDYSLPTQSALYTSLVKSCMIGHISDLVFAFATLIAFATGLMVCMQGLLVSVAGRGMITNNGTCLLLSDNILN